MRIALGSDHGGYGLKQEVKKYLEEKGFEYQDFGCTDTKSCDYPEFGSAAAKAVASGECDKGIVICTTGIGISITANKIKGIRCALCSDLGIVDTFLHTDFPGEEKHRRRVAAIEALEAETMK